MNQLSIILNKSDEFDAAVHGTKDVPSLPSGADLTIITKANATEEGRAAAVITWTVEVDGKLRRAQYSVSVRHLKGLLAFLSAAYDDEGMPLRPH